MNFIDPEVWKSLPIDIQNEILVETTRISSSSTIMLRPDVLSTTKRSRQTSTNESSVKLMRKWIGKDDSLTFSNEKTSDVSIISTASKVTKNKGSPKKADMLMIDTIDEEPSQLYYDNDFPPAPSSIDGRHRKQYHTVNVPNLHVYDKYLKMFLPMATLPTTYYKAEWETVVVIDDYLPCKPDKKRKGSIELAYSRSKSSQLWVPFIEKAYAKIHGSYHAISGGHISEALWDLTGRPCETIDFSDTCFNSEDTWIRLVSFVAAGFPMGCATDSSGEGIVGMHAYSLLDARELPAVVLGSQTTLKDFFRTNNTNHTDDI
eukprot:gene38189-50082_t